jgi:hypothetical protein
MLKLGSTLKLNVYLFCDTGKYFSEEIILATIDDEKCTLKIGEVLNDAFSFLNFLYYKSNRRMYLKASGYNFE